MYTNSALMTRLCPSWSQLGLNSPALSDCTWLLNTFLSQQIRLWLAALHLSPDLVWCGTLGEEKAFSNRHAVNTWYFIQLGEDKEECKGLTLHYKQLTMFSLYQQYKKKSVSTGFVHTVFLWTEWSINKSTGHTVDQLSQIQLRFKPRTNKHINRSSICTSSTGKVTPSQCLHPLAAGSSGAPHSFP